MKHQTPHEFYVNPLKIDLVGAGATGSLILAGLVRLHLAMLELGHPHGLHVCCWDPDTVSHANIGRQLFRESEIGCNKAVTLINRYNYHFGLEWEAFPERFHTESSWDKNKVVISAVDTRKSRSEIKEEIKKTVILTTLNRDAVWTLGRCTAGTARRNYLIHGKITLICTMQNWMSQITPVAPPQIRWNITDFSSINSLPPAYWSFSGSFSETAGWIITNSTSI